VCPARNADPVDRTGQAIHRTQPSRKMVTQSSTKLTTVEGGPLRVPAVQDKIEIGPYSCRISAAVLRTSPSCDLAVAVRMGRPRRQVSFSHRALCGMRTPMVRRSPCTRATAPSVASSSVLVGSRKDAVDVTIGQLAHACEARKLAPIGQQEGQRPGCEIETAHALNAFNRLRLAKGTTRPYRVSVGRAITPPADQHSKRLFQTAQQALTGTPPRWPRGTRSSVRYSDKRTVCKQKLGDDHAERRIAQT